MKTRLDYPEKERPFFDRLTPLQREMAERMSVLPSELLAADSPAQDQDSIHSRLGVTDADFKEEGSR